MQRKAQSALEFLTTYGWAFLVILIMIAALAYFGVLDPSRFLPDKCVFEAGIGCSEVSLETDRTQFVLTNGLASALNITKVAIVDSASVCNPAPVLAWQDATGAVFDPATTFWGQNQRIVGVITCAASSGAQANFDLEITYRTVTGLLNQTLTGQIAGRVN